MPGVLVALCVLFISVVEAEAPSYYDIMGLKNTASTQEVKRAFRHLGLVPRVFSISLNLHIMNLLHFIPLCTSFFLQP